MPKRKYSAGIHTAGGGAPPEGSENGEGTGTRSRGAGGEGGTGLATLDECLEEVTQFTKSKPAEALIFAAAAGVVFRLLPVGAMLAVATRLALHLLRPALLIFAAVKGWKYLQEERH